MVGLPSNNGAIGDNIKGGAHREVGALSLNSLQMEKYMPTQTSLESLWRRYERLSAEAFSLKEWLESNETLGNILDHKIIKVHRRMNALFAETTILSICLTTFRDSCYEPLGPLV